MCDPSSGIALRTSSSSDVPSADSLSVIEQSASNQSQVIRPPKSSPINVVSMRSSSPIRMFLRVAQVVASSRQQVRSKLMSEVQGLGCRGPFGGDRCGAGSACVA